MGPNISYGSILMLHNAQRWDGVSHFAMECYEREGRFDLVM